MYNYVYICIYISRYVWVTQRQFFRFCRGRLQQVLDFFGGVQRLALICPVVRVGQRLAVGSTLTVLRWWGSWQLLNGSGPCPGRELDREPRDGPPTAACLPLCSVVGNLRVVKESRRAYVRSPQRFESQWRVISSEALEWHCPEKKRLRDRFAELSTSVHSFCLLRSQRATGRIVV